MTKYNLA